MKSIFSLNKKPWRFTFLIVLIGVICYILVLIALTLILQLMKDFTQIPPFWPTLLSHILIVFIVAPFVLGFLGKKQTYGDYFSEIRLTKMQPLLGLILLGLSCYLIMALSQVAGVLVYRLTQGLPVDGSFIRSSFVLANELPPRSANWLISIPSIFEEVVWRGVILAAFLRIYDQPKAILYTALCFGLWHILSLLDGNPVWTAGQVVWSAILGLFYGYVTLKTSSLLPAMMVHYLVNLFVSATNAYIQANASIQAVVVYGLVFTFGIIPTSLMILWTRLFTTRWPMLQKPDREWSKKKHIVLLKRIDAQHYPDVAEAGGLDIAISKSLASQGSHLVASTIPIENFPPTAIVEEGSRSSNGYLASGQRLFLFNFWSEGVRFGEAASKDISEVAHAIHFWIIKKPSIEKMQSIFEFFTPTIEGHAHEAGLYVEYQWHELLERWRNEEIRTGKEQPTVPLIEAAMNKPELRQLFPVTSMACLCFSRSTGYPFTRDCPSVAPREDGPYVVYAPDSDNIIGKGSIDEVIDILIEHLPENCGPAVNGTADDFIDSP